jgi:hypothetical protein
MVKLTWRLRWKRWFAVTALFVVALGIGGVVAQVNADDPVPMKHAHSGLQSEGCLAPMPSSATAAAFT